MNRKDYLKAKKVTTKRKQVALKKGGKPKKTFTTCLTKKAKKVTTLDIELSKQRFKGCPADSIKSKMKGKSSSWRRGGEFPANRPRAGWSGRARWTKGNDWSNDNEAGKVYHYAKEDVE